MGFWVATTVNSSDSGWLTPSMVTVFSSITSRSADCVLGGVRLISSATRMSVKTGPERNSNWLLCKLKTLVPRMSDGIRSGVNWTRLQSSASRRASVRAISVLAVPGTPSSRTWPPHNSASNINSRLSRWPTTTRSARFKSDSTSSGTVAVPSARISTPLRPQARSLERLFGELVKGPRPTQQLGVGQIRLAQLGQTAQQRLQALGRRAGVLLSPGREDDRRQGGAPQAQVLRQGGEEVAGESAGQQAARAGPLVEAAQRRGVIDGVRAVGAARRHGRAQPHRPRPGPDAGDDEQRQERPAAAVVGEVAPEAA